MNRLGERKAAEGIHQQIDSQQQPKSRHSGDRIDQHQPTDAEQQRRLEPGHDTPRVIVEGMDGPEDATQNQQPRQEHFGAQRCQARHEHPHRSQRNQQNPGDQTVGAEVAQRVFIYR